MKTYAWQKDCHQLQSIVLCTLKNKREEGSKTVYRADFLQLLPERAHKRKRKEDSFKTPLFFLTTLLLVWQQKGWSALSYFILVKTIRSIIICLLLFQDNHSTTPSACEMTIIDTQSHQQEELQLESRIKRIHHFMMIVTKLVRTMAEKEVSFPMIHNNVRREKVDHSPAASANDGHYSILCFNADDKSTNTSASCTKMRKR